MTDAERLAELRRLWLVAGVNPGYHAMVKEQLRQQWPLLYEALDAIALDSA